MQLIRSSDAGFFRHETFDKHQALNICVANEISESLI